MADSHEQPLLADHLGIVPPGEWQMGKHLQVQFLSNSDSRHLQSWSNPEVITEVIWKYCF